MYHRHLTHQGYTLGAIDDIIVRGRLQDWTELRDAALADTGVLEKILKTARSRGADPHEQRYRFWKHYAESRFA